jgi:hypothetical protein
MMIIQLAINVQKNFCPCIFVTNLTEKMTRYLRRMRQFTGFPFQGLPWWGTGEGKVRRT